jgi:hypothetical protein
LRSGHIVRQLGQILDESPAPIPPDRNVVIKKGDPLGIHRSPPGIAGRSRSAAAGTDDDQRRCCRRKIKYTARHWGWCSLRSRVLIRGGIVPIIDDHNACWRRFPSTHATSSAKRERPMVGMTTA